MTPTEFDDWIRYHGDCVGGFSDWLTRNRDQRETAKVLRLWSEALSDVSLEDARHASMAIMRGDLDVMAFGNHPKAIRKWAKDARGSRAKREKKFIDGAEVFRCGMCLDGGLVICYDPSAIKRVIRSRIECVWTAEPRQNRDTARRYMPDMRTCAYACTCDEGQEKQERGHTVYDEQRCILVTVHTHEMQIDELFREVDLRRTVKRHNYTPGFAEFNAGGVVNKEIDF